MSSLTAIRANHVGGHVAMATVPYFPQPPVPTKARERFKPWACTFHTDDGGPRHFVAFGGQAGMVDTVYALLGALLLQMHGGLFLTLESRVDFELNQTPLEGSHLNTVADALEAFIESPSFAIDCHLVGADPHMARLNLQIIRTTIKAGRSLVL